MFRVKDGEGERLLTIEEFESEARRGALSPFAWVQSTAFTGDRFVQARELPFFVALYDPRPQNFRQYFQLSRVPVVTMGLVLLLVGMFLVSCALGDGAVNRNVLLALGAKAKARIVEDGQTWRIITANLLHRDGVHLGFNVFALMNIGAVLENIYRRSDYVLLLVLSGCSAMALSAAMSPPVTVGASGLVFGCLGAAMVFGVRYAHLLPMRYRVYFGVIVVVYTVTMFYLGLQSQNTDNWGHAGGILCGLCMGAILVPRLLRLTRPRESARASRQPVLVTLAVIVGVAGPLGPLTSAVFFRQMTYTLPQYGIEFRLPAHWHQVTEPMGFLTFGNGIDAFAALGCTAASDASQLDLAVERFWARDLVQLSRAGSISDLEVGRLTNGAVGIGSDAVSARVVPLSFLSSDGPLQAESYLFVRGYFECTLVLAHRPDVPTSSLQRLEEVRLGLRWTPTDEERRHEQQVQRDPKATNWLALARAHARAGRIVEARRAFEAALALMAPGSRTLAQAQFAFARFEARQGGDLEHAQVMAQTLFQQSQETEPRLLLFDILVGRERLAEAASLIESAIAASPDEPRFHEAMHRLQLKRLRLTGKHDQSDGSASP